LKDSRESKQGSCNSEDFETLDSFDCIQISISASPLILRSLGSWEISFP
jgi:hypothetical protein